MMFGINNVSGDDRFFISRKLNIGCVFLDNFFPNMKTKTKFAETLRRVFND